MHVSLADVFVHRVVRDEAGTVPRAIALRVKSLVVVIHAGKQCRRRLIAVLSSDRRIGQRGLKWHAVFSRPREGILQC